MPEKSFSVDIINMVIEEISGKFYLSECTVAGIMAHIFMDVNIKQLISPTVAEFLEKNILAHCTGDNKYYSDKR